MSKHTPAPWITCNTSDVFTKLGAPNAEGTNAPLNDGWMIADCDAGSLSLAEVKANARLIAAAPDGLAAALKALDECCDLIGTPAGDALQAFINKATGE